MGLTSYMVIQSLLILLLLTISIIDIRTKRIPDYLIYSGIVFFLSYNILIKKQSILILFTLIFTGFIPFFLIWYFTKGKLGLGDAKFSAFLALALGLRSWFVMVFASSFTALIFALYMLKVKKITGDTKIPYGPFLSLGALISLYFV
jgi:prepilin signal peptidase PulO-like enzyme (type II secretory pathway)